MQLALAPPLRLDDTPCRVIAKQEPPVIVSEVNPLDGHGPPCLLSFELNAVITRIRAAVVIAAHPYHVRNAVRKGDALAVGYVSQMNAQRANGANNTQPEFIIQRDYFFGLAIFSHEYFSPPASCATDCHTS